MTITTPLIIIATIVTLAWVAFIVVHDLHTQRRERARRHRLRVATDAAIKRRLAA